jgi:hypothetical protein
MQGAIFEGLKWYIMAMGITTKNTTMSDRKKKKKKDRKGRDNSHGYGIGRDSASSIPCLTATASFFFHKGFQACSSDS